MNLSQKLISQFSGLFQSQKSKTEELRVALHSADVKAARTALIKGAVPSIAELENLLFDIFVERDVLARKCSRMYSPSILSESKLMSQTFIEFCKLFQAWGVDLSDGKDIDIFPLGALKLDKSLIEKVIKAQLEPTVTQFLIDIGVKPTTSDLSEACSKGANPKHLEILLESRISI